MGKLELLAPAGNMLSFKAAVENGADAVYMGLDNFNARKMTENFGIEEYKEAILYAHKRNTKVYLTMNILMYDEELEEALKSLIVLYKNGLDGVIVQDLGLAKLIKKVIPNLPLHASTQLTVHNKKQVKLLENLGFSRVVLAREMSISEIEEIGLTAATELEFWVNTPEDKADLEKLYTSQSLKEQYWKRTHGVIRTCLEESLIILEKMGIEPEMAHKEVGGIPSSISIEGKTNHAMEQLEISWKFSNPLQAADNELIVRDVVEDVFTAHGLEVTFKAKPIDGVAGNGGHTHFGVSVLLKNGKRKNVFAPTDMKNDYLSIAGYGALMGMLYNYEVINPFVTSSIDGFNRLVPGFEAPICVVTSLGHTYEQPSRNRSVLVGLIRDMKNPKTLRFELRSPNPLSNKYLVIAAGYQAMLEGIKVAAESGFDTKELEKELSKKAGEEGFYLEKDRSYRDEHDIFEYYSEEERRRRFGNPPATVYENMKNIEKLSHKLKCLKQGDVFTDAIIQSFKVGAIDKWQKKLKTRLIEQNITRIRALKKLHTPENMDALDEVIWKSISDMKYDLMKDTLTKESLFTKVRNAVDNKEYAEASRLQLEMKRKMNEIEQLYLKYKKNIY